MPVNKMVWTIAAVSLLGVVTFIGLGIYLARRLTHQTELDHCRDECAICRRSGQSVGRRRRS